MEQKVVTWVLAPISTKNFNVYGISFIDFIVLIITGHALLLGEMLNCGSTNLLLCVGPSKTILPY